MQTQLPKMFQRVVNMAPKWGSEIVSRYKKRLWRDIEKKKKKLKKYRNKTPKGTKTWTARQRKAPYMCIRLHNKWAKIKQELSLYLSFGLCVWLSLCLSFCLSVCLSACLWGIVEMGFPIFAKVFDLLSFSLIGWQPRQVIRVIVSMNW